MTKEIRKDKRNFKQGRGNAAMMTLLGTYRSHNGKLSDKWSANIAAYERLFAPYRNLPVRILEIGLQNGGSLEIWSKFFPNAAAIVGCDIDEKCRDLVFEDPRISIMVGDMNDPAVFEQIISICSEFDIIIDDGSHLSGDIVRAFAKFFPLVSVGGMFIAEDLHCSYWADYAGGLEYPGSSLNFFRRLADLTNKEHWGGELSAADSLSYFGELYDCNFDEESLLGVAQVSFMNSLAVVHRSTMEDRALGPRVVVGRDAFVSDAPVGLDGTLCPEFPQDKNSYGPAAPRRESLSDLIAEREAELVVLRSKHQSILTEFTRLAGKYADFEADRQRSFDENAALRRELAYARSRAHRVWGEYLAHKALLWLSTSSLPLGSRARDRFARSAAKRDPKRSLKETDPASDHPVRPRPKRPPLVKLAEIRVLHLASKLTSGVSPRHSEKFLRSAKKREDRLTLFEVGNSKEVERQVAPAAHCVEYHVLRCAPIGAGADVLILVLFSADGCLSDIHARQIAAYEAAGYTLVVVINSPLWIVASETLKAHPALQSAPVVIVRDNLGFDFGAWSQAVNVIGGLGQDGTLSFTNDSVLPINDAALRDLRARACALHGAIFATANQEIKPHCQSYFFTISGDKIESALGVLGNIPLYDDKWDLIAKEELHLSDRLAAAGMDVHTLFHVKDSKDPSRNPSIHEWRALLTQGFPFIKIQLFTSGFVSLEDSEVLELLGADGAAGMKAHLDDRLAVSKIPAIRPNQPLKPALSINGRYSSSGAMQAYNPPSNARPSIVLPFIDTDKAPGLTKRVLVVLHAFYPDIAIHLVQSLLKGSEAQTLARFHFVLTTDNEAKAEALSASLTASLADSAELDILVCENRGRDVAPFLTACARCLRNHDLVLHLHTKKSPHDGNLREWGGYLFDCLFGSPKIIRSTMQLFDNPSLGLVFPGHFHALTGMRNWGFDFQGAQDLMVRMGLSLRADVPLDFPTGTMFWARPDAIRPLIDLGLQPADFPPEEGQTDGTLAHSIERILTHVVESRGYVVQSVVANTRLVDHEGLAIEMGLTGARAFVGRIQARLKHFAQARSDFDRAVPEVYDVSAGASATPRRRLNIIVPSVQPEKIYGGVSTALRAGLNLWKAHGDVDLRLIVTSDETDAHGVAEVARRFNCPVSICAPEDDAEGATLTCLKHQRFRPLSLRAGDYFFGTAWWTADLGFRLRAVQKELFGTAPRMVYLIQDYEPGFYRWSNQYALALRTYGKPDDTIALVNSEELANFVALRHDYPAAFCVPYELEPRLAERIRPTPKERIVLVYGRPTVARNAFDIIVEGIRQWQMQSPVAAKDWRIVMAGEEFDARLLSGLENADVVGKLSLEEYGDMLNRSAVGLSMMISPHPSYPPLEMASAGLLTITNRFEGKDLSQRADTITSITDVAPDAIASALAHVTAAFVPGTMSIPTEIKRLPSPYPWIDYGTVARLQSNDAR